MLLYWNLMTLSGLLGNLISKPRNGLTSGLMTYSYQSNWLRPFSLLDPFSLRSFSIIIDGLLYKDLFLLYCVVATWLLEPSSCRMYRRITWKLCGGCWCWFWLVDYIRDLSNQLYIHWLSHPPVACHSLIISQKLTSYITSSIVSQKLQIFSLTLSVIRSSHFS